MKFIFDGIRKLVLFEIVEDISWLEKKSNTIIENEKKINII